MQTKSYLKKIQKNLNKKALEDIPLLFFTVIILGAILLFIVLIKNAYLTEAYDLHSAEQNLASNLLGNSGYGMIIEDNKIKSASSSAYLLGNLLDTSKLTQDFLKDVLDLDQTETAFKIEIFDLAGKSISGPFYSNPDKFQLYSELSFSSKYDDTESKYLVKLPDPDKSIQLKDAILVITTSYATHR
ncbi:TPA: hypothetical protein HA246_05240 [Candidatus Woesearchaeota archaeon]|nr:hypothetical protein [Candidatus Woesearchaeota archaeon]